MIVAYLSTIGKNQITGNAHPAADGKFNINTSVLRSVNVPIPSASEQAEIMAVVSALDRVGRAARERHAAAKRLFEAVLPRLVTGELRLPADAGVIEEAHV